MTPSHPDAPESFAPAPPQAAVLAASDDPRPGRVPAEVLVDEGAVVEGLMGQFRLGAGWADPQVEPMAQRLALPPALLPAAQALADSLFEQFLKVLPFVHTPAVSFTLEREAAWGAVLAWGPSGPLLVTLSLVRAFRRAGCRATFTGKDPLYLPEGSSDSPPVVSVLGDRIDGWAFLHMAPEEQARHVPDEGERDRIIGLMRSEARPAETEPGATPNVWKLVFYLGD